MNEDQENTAAAEAAPAAKTDFVPSEAKEGKNQKVRVGIVKSTSMNKTIVVESGLCLRRQLRSSHRVRRISSTA